jgi:hypothetical protein
MSQDWSVTNIITDIILKVVGVFVDWCAAQVDLLEFLQFRAIPLVQPRVDASRLLVTEL